MPAVRLTRTRTRASIPNTMTQLASSHTPSLGVADLGYILSPTRDISTEPTTPTSPTLRTSGYRRRALRREPSADFLQAVLHYDRAKNDVRPWYWYVL